MKHPEDCSHHLLFLYYPFRNEDQLFSVNTQSYEENLYEPGVFEEVNSNKPLIKPFSDIVDQAFEQFISSTINLSTNSYAQQENENIHRE